MMCAPATRLFNLAWALRFGNALRSLDSLDGPARDVSGVGRRPARRRTPPLRLGLAFFIFVSSFAAAKLGKVRSFLEASPATA